MQQEEQDWLIQAQKGDSQAFSFLVEAYQRPVYNLCYRMLGNAEDAEDGSQETFLRAYRSIRQFDRSRPFPTWLLSIAAHYCIDQIRRRKTPVISTEDMLLPDLPDPAPDMDSRLSRKEEQQQIRSLLQVLDATDRAVVVMYYWYDLSYIEIADSLKLTEGAVKSRLHRARRSMAQCWLDRQPAPSPQAERIMA